MELDSDYERTAVRAVQILGLKVAGVDLLESQEGPQVLEVNSSPGLEGIETTTGVDVATAIVEYLEEQVTFPELDIRERLSLSKGFGVCEVKVPRGSQLAGKSIANSGLSDQDIMVLRISRDTRFISNPKGSREIRAGDRLLCFGRQQALKQLLPKRRRRRRKKKAAATPVAP